MQTPDEVRRITDPPARIAAAQQARDEAQALVPEYTAIVRDTVRAMRESMSLAAVAAVLGVSKTRVAQLEGSQPPRGRRRAAGDES